MLLYLIIFLIPVIMFYANDDDAQSKKQLAIYIGSLGLFVACADMLGGYDRYIYGEVFDEISLAVRNNGNMYQTAGYQLFSTEWAYLWLNRLIGYISVNRYIFIFLVTVIIYTLLYVSIAEYCENYPLALVMFLGLWFFFTFTYLRQVLAATVGWLVFRYAIERKPIPFFGIVLLAFGFHNSAIILAPLYFIPKKLFPKNIVILGLVASLAIGLTNVTGAMVGSADAIMDQARSAENASLAEGAFRPAYFLEAIFFMVIIFWNYDLYEQASNKQIYMLNVGIIFCATLLMFIRSENGGRIAWYFIMGIFSALSFILSSHEKNSLFPLMIIFVSIALYFRIFNAWQKFNTLYPYKTFFTNGHRTPDIYFDHYEYDPNYDTDKFYK